MTANENKEQDVSSPAKDFTRCPIPPKQPSKLYRYFKNLLKVVLAVSLFVLAVICLSFYLKGYSEGGLIKKTVVDSRDCEIKIPGTDQTITGKRSYQYQYSQFAGWRYYNTSTVHEETRLDINGTKMTIIGSSVNTPSDKVWSKNIDDGERYAQLLQNEDRYTLIYGDARKVISVDYSVMCK